MFIKLNDFKRTIIDLNNVSIIQTDYKDFTIATKDGKMVCVEYGSSDKKEADLKLIDKALGIVGLSDEKVD